MITGLPAYVPPQLQEVRCPCGSLYLVHTGAGEERATEGREHAEVRGARFVDARRTPFLQCECGQALDFAPEISRMIQ